MPPGIHSNRGLIETWVAVSFVKDDAPCERLKKQAQKQMIIADHT